MKILFVCTSLLLSLCANAQIGALRKAQDTRKKYINKETTSTAKRFDKLNYVNPFVGTGGHGHTYPGASAPFGMMQLSPDTRFDGWDGCSGYHYSDSIIYGFSHTHLSGTGVSDYGDLLLMPQNGKPWVDPGYASEKGYGSEFSHKEEHASPGYYDVRLKNGDIGVRLTVSDRAGFHEYTFNKESGKKFIIIDLDHRDKLLSSSIDVVDKKTISGSRVSKSWAEEQHFYFFLELDTPFQKAREFKSKGRNKLLLVFPKGTKKINLKVGMSSVDVRGAKNNLKEEMSSWDFATAKSKVENKWRRELDKIYFYTRDSEVMTNFYTSLYHSYLNPNVFTDVDGRYRGRDKKNHQLKPGESDQYTVFSLWDTYRGAHPLFTLTQVDRTKDFIHTFLRQYDEGGDLPVWELAGNETECMIGYHSVSVIADAYTKGIDDFDAFHALEAMIATSQFDEYGKKAFKEFGFIDAGVEPESVSKTLEYAYDDFCIHEMMKLYTRQTEDNYFVKRLDEYRDRSLNFINLYDPQSKFMRARRSGQWFSPFDPTEVNFNYTEANSWQYSLYTPHAVGVLSNLMGGKDELESWLDKLFTTSSDMGGRHQSDITGLIGQYAHGNEPSHHMAYLYNYTDSPEKTQLYIDSIQHTMYSNAPDGLSGNEDCGQMSAWYVLSALGFYQIAPSRPIYDIGHPLMDEALIQFENGNKLSIKTIKRNSDCIYIQKIRLNGKELKRRYLTHNELIEGGVLEYTMISKPDPSIRELRTAPTMSELPESVVPVPYFKQEERIFTDDMEISLDMINSDDYWIYYTIDGSSPIDNKKALTYSKPFKISESTTIKAFAASSEGHSGMISNKFVKKNQNISIQLNSEYANQYAASGKLTLIDGIHGGDEFRTGDWQGYWAQDVVAEVDFKTPVALSEVGIGCLSDMKSWVFFPSEVIIEGSFDGKTFTKIGSIELATEVEKDMYPHHKDVVVKTNNTIPYKKIRVTAKNYGKCPEWHLGDGNDTWLFVDEIILK